MASSLIAATAGHMQHAWQRYCDQLMRRPLATKIATGACSWQETGAGAPRLRNDRAVRAAALRRRRPALPLP